jgi:glycosyltransferase involved in cell wall biosynthesis
MGKPIIGSKLAGIPEQIDHLGEGILVSPRSSKDLAEAINTLLENPELRRTMGIAGRERYLKCFTAEIAVENYLSLYSTALSSSR